MKIFLACPAPPWSRKGNRVTAVRWAHILRDLGHRLLIGQDFHGELCDLMVALHARKSHPAIRAFRRLHPAKPLILCLTGTDLYRDIRTSRPAQESLELADRLVLLQAAGLQELPARLRGKARVIVQSAEPTGLAPAAANRFFDVCVLGHLRDEKDPFRAALALRQVPKHSRIRITQLGEALSAGMARRAMQLMRADARYRWLGEVARGRARRRLARSHLMVISSKMEGGANVVCEALADAVPILASRMSGNLGLLGRGYPGYFPVGDTAALARLLARAENDPSYYHQLKVWCRQLTPMVEPERERAGWAQLLAELKTSPADRHIRQWSPGIQ